MNIGLDVKGADNGARPHVMAVLKVCKNNKNYNFTLYGDEKETKALVEKEAKNYGVDLDYVFSKISIVNCPETIEMNEHPVLALRTKTKSSIVLAGDDLNNGKIDCIISAGSTGALLALSQFYIKTIEGIDRAVVGTIVPTKKGKTLILDMGANMDPKPEWLHQYASIANVYFKMMYKKDNPTIGLLSVGTEENKGNQLVNETYPLLKNDTRLNFIGNVEAREVASGVSDIIICDGFSGNVLLKMYEGTAKTLFSLIKDAIKSNPISLFGALFILPSLKGLLTKFDAKTYGGAPYLGCKKLIIKCHGNATEKEIEHAIYQAKDYIENNITEKIKEYIKGA